jgi:hypothetical protein
MIRLVFLLIALLSASPARPTAAQTGPASIHRFPTPDSPTSDDSNVRIQRGFDADLRRWMLWKGGEK